MRCRRCRGKQREGSWAVFCTAMEPRPWYEARSLDLYRAAACEREAPGLMAAGEEPSCAVARRRTFVVSEEGTANVTQVVAVVAFLQYFKLPITTVR